MNRCYNRHDKYYAVRMYIDGGGHQFIAEITPTLSILDLAIFPTDAMEFASEQAAYHFVLEHCEKYPHESNIDMFTVLEVNRRTELTFDRPPINDTTKKMIEGYEQRHQAKIDSLRRITANEPPKD